MKKKKIGELQIPPKAPAGIRGLPEITRTGLPRGRATLVVGDPGSAKSLLALRTLGHVAIDYNEPGIFVASQESSVRLIANAAKFGRNLPALPPSCKSFAS